MVLSSTSENISLKSFGVRPLTFVHVSATDVCWLFEAWPGLPPFERSMAVCGMLVLRACEDVLVLLIIGQNDSCHGNGMPRPSSCQEFET